MGTLGPKRLFPHGKKLEKKMNKVSQKKKCMGTLGPQPLDFKKKCQEKKSIDFHGIKKRIKIDDGRRMVRRRRGGHDQLKLGGIVADY